VTACSSGAASLAVAAELIADGVVDVALAGGADALTRICFMGFNALKLLDPAPCRPFDRDRKGMSIGEGAAFVVLESADRARARGLRVVDGTLETAGFEAGSFDVITMWDVIEHLPDPGSTLDRIARLLVSRGILYLALPDAGSPLARLLGARWWSVLPTHLQYFTRASIARLLTDHGYAVELMETAPKAFSVRYYLERLEGFSQRMAETAVAMAERSGVAERLVWPDFRDRMAVVARRRAS
jgi:SAM-dependent methyltransferase